MVLNFLFWFFHCQKLPCEFGINDQAYMQLLSLKWHIYHVEFHLDRFDCILKHMFWFIKWYLHIYVLLFIVHAKPHKFTTKTSFYIEWHMWAIHWCINCQFNDLFNLVASKFYVTSMGMPKKHLKRIFHFSHYATDMFLELCNCFYIINKIVKLWIIYGHSTACSNS